MKSKFARFVLLGSAIALAMALLPYLVARLGAPPEARFTGYLYNPADGGSYLAKMRLGWLGRWRFRLMFTPEEQQGAPLFLFHLGLGHLARLLRLPLATVYHAARITGSLALLAALGWLAGLALPAGRARRWGFVFALLGGGIGWAFLWIGEPLPVDIWVPEGYALYSTLANAHFPWAQVLLLLILALTALWHAGTIAAQRALPAIAGLMVALGVLQPFAVGQVGLIWAVWLAMLWIRERELPWRVALPLGVVGAIGLAYPLYGVWSIQQDPVLAAWNAQNVTASPPWWNWLIGYGLLVPWAIAGGLRAWRERQALPAMLLAWALGSILGIAFPISLQRRLSLGLSVPLGLLAGLGWAGWFEPRAGQRGPGLLKAGLAVLLALTPLFLLLTGLVSPRQMPGRFYIGAGERAAAQVLLAQRDEAHVILATPERGEALPWLTGHPVVVGHEFETADYQRRAEAARQFFAGAGTVAARQSLLCREGVTHVWYGPLERALGSASAVELPGLSLILENADARVYAVERETVCAGE